MEEVLAGLARGELYQPLRSVTRPAGADSLFGLMPAHRGGDGPLFAEGDRDRARQPGAAGSIAHQGAVLLHDGETGELLALLNASAITEIRTAAVSAVATRRSPGRTRAWSRSSAAGSRPARTSRRCAPCSRTPRSATWSVGVDGGTPEEALHDADVVCTCTTAREPILQPRVARAGRARERGRLERPDGARARHRDGRRGPLFVDRRESALNEAGDLLLAGLGEEQIAAELGEVLAGAHPGRRPTTS